MCSLNKMKNLAILISLRMAYIEVVKHKKSTTVNKRMYSFWGRPESDQMKSSRLKRLHSEKLLVAFTNIWVTFNGRFVALPSC